MSENVHSTLAANRLDPNIEADGHLNAGQGVGGTSEGNIEKEGVEHVKKHGYGTDDPTSQSQTQSQTQSEYPTQSQTQSEYPTQSQPQSEFPAQTQSTVHQEGIDHIRSKTFDAEPASSHATTSNASGLQAPASNPGIDDQTGGIGSGAGGVSNTAHIDTPVRAAGAGENESTLSSTSEPQSVIGSTVEGIKSYLGFGSTATTSTAASSETPGYGTTGGVTRAEYDGPASEYHPSSSSTTTDPAYTNTSSTSNTMSDSSAPSQAEQRIADNTADDFPTQDTKGVASHERGLEDSETTTGADKQTTDTTDEGQAGAGPGDTGKTNKPPAAAGGHTGSLENKDAIPTAGGERLGEKHWGESKIVPDVPKKQSDDVGVASKDGQPTDEVKDNTAANTGGATGGPHSHSHGDSAGKEGLADKIKDRLHLGKK